MMKLFSVLIVLILAQNVLSQSPYIGKVAIKHSTVNSAINTTFCKSNIIFSNASLDRIVTVRQY